jgi:hypothetical protein
MRPARSAVPPTVIAKVRNGVRATGERLPGTGWVRRAHWFLGEHPGDPRAICRGPLGRSVNSQHYLACPESVLFGPAVPRHDAPVGLADGACKFSVRHDVRASGENTMERMESSGSRCPQTALRTP